MASSEGGFGGSLGGQFRIRVYADVVAQEEDNNRSLVRYSAVVDRISGTGRVYNLYNNTYGNTWIGGYGNPQRGPFSYDSRGPGRVITMALNEDRWYGHDGNGNGGDSFGANYDFGNGPYVTSGSTAFSMGFPQLYRYAAPNAIYFYNVTDTSFQFRVVTNRVVDNIAIKINGVGWYYYEGATTDRTVTFDNLKSDTDYGIHISLRRQASGNWQEHGDWYTRTATQNKFFDIGDF